jgi:hypothetical protein|nr:MAG TPA: hypothetical protein [Crassvirales sp.]
MKKANSKVGAEPRIKRKFYKNEGFHIGVHRDEWGLFDSKRNPYCFVNGYFFTYGKWFIRNHTTLEDIKNSWNDYSYKGNIYNACFGIIDRKRKIAVINDNNYYSYSLERAVPDNYTILRVNEIRDFDITKNLHKLYTEHCKYLIDRFINLISDYYNVVNNNKAKVVFTSNYIQEKIDDIIYKLEKVSSEHNISRTKDLFEGKEYFLNVSKSWRARYIKVKHPTINQIITNTVFTDEQKAYIEKCKFYSEYRNSGIVWKDILTKSKKEIVDEVEEKEKAFKIRWGKALKVGEENKRKAIEESDCELTLEKFRNGDILNSWITYKVPVRGLKFNIFWFDKTIRVRVFKNIQLRLNTRTDVIITSNNASVLLSQAITLFNVLYDKYFSHYDYTNTDDYFIDFTKRNITINYYNLRHICFTEKKTDDGERLGYMEWRIQIGCHTLWLDDIKEFCRYYHLEDRVHFDCSARNINQLTNK